MKIFEYLLLLSFTHYLYLKICTFHANGSTCDIIILTLLLRCIAVNMRIS